MPIRYDRMLWKVATTSLFDEWFASLSEDGQAEIIAKVELLKVMGLYDSHLLKIKARKKGKGI